MAQFRVKFRVRVQGSGFKVGLGFGLGRPQFSRLGRVNFYVDALLKFIFKMSTKPFW
jgi:hypothetical protein